MLLVAVAGASGSPNAGVVDVSGRMPTLSGSLIGGGRLPAASFRGKVVIVNFWNPYCGPCRKEASALERAWMDLRGRGVLIVGIHYVGGSWPRSVPAAR